MAFLIDVASIGANATPAQFPLPALTPWGLSAEYVHELTRLEKRTARNYPSTLSSSARSFGDWLASVDDEAAAACLEKANRTALSWKQSQSELDAQVDRNRRLHGIIFILS
jgi:hypothetical protein